jgi:hypothetical protein
MITHNLNRVRTKVSYLDCH